MANPFNKTKYGYLLLTKICKSAMALLLSYFAFTLTATRRFNALPSAVALSASGHCGP